MEQVKNEVSGRIEVIAERACTTFTSRGFQYHDNGDRPGSSIGFATKGAAVEHAKNNGWPKSSVRKYVFYPWGWNMYCVTQQRGTTHTEFVMGDGRIFVVPNK